MDADTEIGRMGRRNRSRSKKTRREAPAQPPGRSSYENAPDVDLSSVASPKATVLCYLIIAVASIIAFLPAARNEFVDWDDFQNLTRNEHIRALSFENLRWMATTGYMAVWQPVSWFVTAVQYQLFDGANEAAFSRGMHLANIGLHAIASVLCFSVIRRLLALGLPEAARRSPNALAAASLIGTLLFAVHPLRVELVAWATAQPYILALIGCLTSLWCYLRAHITGLRRWLAFSWLTYAVAVMCKSAAMPLCVIVLLIDWQPLRRIGRPGNRLGTASLWLEKIPFVLIALATSLAAYLTKERGGSTMSLAAHGVIERAAQACYGLVFYTWKTLAPLDLSPLYEIRLPLDYTDLRYVVCGLIVLLVIVGLLLYGRRLPAVAAGTLAYAVMVFPVLGVLQSGNQEVADRYSYLPCVAWSVLLSAGLLRFWPSRRRIVTETGVVAAGVIVLLSALTWRQCGVWRNTAALWTRAWELQRGSSLAQNSYAYAVLMQQGRYEEAVPHLRRAIEIKPTNDKAHFNLHNALFRLNRTDELFEACEQSVRIFEDNPRFSEITASAHTRMGNILYRRGDMDAAVGHYRTSLSIRPDDASTHGSLAVALARKGDRAGSKRHARRALELDPSLLPPRRVLARALKDEGRLDQAIEQAREALKYDPDDPRSQALLKELTQTP